MELVITNDIPLQIKIGKELFYEKVNIYTKQVVSGIKEIIDRCYENFLHKELSKEDLFYISIYDYWTVGCTVAEGLYYRFIDKSYEQKKEFITLRDRLIYTNKLNNKEDAHTLTLKYEAYEILKPLYKRDVERIQDSSDFQKFVEFVSKHKKFVAKPEGASMSIGVHLVDSSEYSSLEVLFNQLLQEGVECQKNCNWCDTPTVVIEEIILQSDDMNQLHPASINNIRCITIRDGDNVKIFYPCVKIGMNNEFICSGASGSLIAAVDPDTGKVVTNGKTEVLTEFDVHPDTNIKLEGFQIPDWDDMLSVVKQAAMRFPTINFIGWDVVHSTNGWCIMEGNYASEFVCCQLPHQLGFRNKFEQLTGIKINHEKFWWQQS